MVGTPSKINDLFDSRESSIEFDYDAIDRALSCNNEASGKCLEDIENTFISSGTPIPRKVQSLSKCAALKYAIKELFHIRLKEPIAFDYICIKTLYPELTYDDITRVMRGCTLDNGLQIEPRLIGRHRARIVEIDTVARLTIMQNDSSYFCFLQEVCKTLKQRTKQILADIKPMSKPVKHIQLEFNFNE
jgi:hypothetical protein